jgi:cell division protein FtsQ
VLKVIDKNGATYYVDIEGEKIDGISKPLRLPVASGEIDDSMIEKELLSVVSAIKKDPFWLAQIQQIYFNDKKEAIITPRVGDHIIELGSVREIEKKLQNLKAFYINGLGTVGWNKYSKLNIKISDKVICTKK